jgi:hypothetical protein
VAKKEWTIERVRREVKRMNPALDEENDGFAAAVVLISSVILGPNVRRIARFTGYSRCRVAEWGRRLRENGIWQGDRVGAAGWFEEDGGLEFWLHVAVAQGLLRMVDASSGAPNE